MKRFKSGTLMLLSVMILVILTGCEQGEQAADSTIEKAKESASQVVDEAKQGVNGLLGQTEEGKPQDSSEQGDAEKQQDDEAIEQTAAGEDKDN